ncbi:hypothetical protein [Burkholderia cenocepacia]|uniref:hypothetical protein n=1 Tax=Burkholderia cenocepacia TaxID=95486 RepID=UPI002AB7359B|nr:hypothetical protein [Burkholderia cenocepacia]
MDDVAVIFDNEAFYRDVFADYAVAYRFAELPVSRKLADAVVKALLLGESYDRAPEGSNMLAVSIGQGETVYVLRREVAVPGIAACGAGGRRKAAALFCKIFACAERLLADCVRGAGEGG